VNDGDGPDLPEGPEAGDRGHLRDGHLRDAQAGHLRDGHLRDGHLRDGHLRDALLTDAGALPTVPDLLATDALLDRLGRHEATAGDLRDTVARLLHGFALHADPETAGVRGLPLPDVADLPAASADGAPGAPRVLVARRRTIERLGRGTAAACAVLALFGGTAAVAATGGGTSLLPRPAAGVAAGAGAPTFSIGGSIITFITGSTEDRAASALQRLTEQATGGDTQQAAAAAQAARRLAVDLRASGASPQLVQQAEAFAGAVQQAITDGTDVGQALQPAAGTLPDTVVDPLPASPTTSTLPYVINQGLRSAAGPGPWAPTAPTSSSSSSATASETSTAAAPVATAPPVSAPAPVAVPSAPRSEPVATRPGGSSPGGSSASSPPVPSVPSVPVPSAPVASTPVVAPSDSATQVPGPPTDQPAPPSATSDPVVTPPPLVTTPPTTPPPTPPSTDPVPTDPPTDGTPSPTDGPPVSSQPTPSEVPVPTGVPTTPSDDGSGTS